MNVQFMMIKELQMLTFFKNQKMDGIETVENNRVIFLVDGKIAGISKILRNDGDSIEIEFIHIIKKNNRRVVSTGMRKELIKNWGETIEKRMANADCLDDIASIICLKIVEEMPNDYNYFATEIDFLLEKASKKVNKDEDRKEKKQINIKKEKLSQHAKTQLYLKEIGEIIGVETWIAKNDHHIELKNGKMGDNFKQFPDFGLDKEAKKTIQLIDSIWFKDGIPLSFFEVEHSTSVASGLNRFADALLSIPNGNMSFYIIAPEKRREKVRKELNRPVFKHFGMVESCRFVPMEKIDLLYDKIKGLDGYIKEDVIDLISEKLVENNEKIYF